MYVWIIRVKLLCERMYALNNIQKWIAVLDIN
jgi:hypothetical protein